MEKVDFTFKNGHIRPMPARQAGLLAKLGHGTYKTRDMANQPNTVQPSMAADDGLDGLDKDQLHDLAEKRGLKLHHMLGAEKARAALREAAAQ
jgi:hypothetical protein